MENLAQYLTRRSKEICSGNECTEEQHFCESYAYLKVYENGDIDLLDICASDYFIGKSNCALPLPFEGGMNDVWSDISRYIDESEEE